MLCDNPADNILTLSVHSISSYVRIQTICTCIVVDYEQKDTCIIEHVM